MITILIVTEALDKLFRPGFKVKLHPTMPFGRCCHAFYQNGNQETKVLNWKASQLNPLSDHQSNRNTVSEAKKVLHYTLTVTDVIRMCPFSLASM